MRQEARTAWVKIAKMQGVENVDAGGVGKVVWYKDAKTKSFRDLVEVAKTTILEPCFATRLTATYKQAEQVSLAVALRDRALERGVVSLAWVSVRTTAGSIKMEDT